MELKDVKSKRDLFKSINNYENQFNSFKDFNDKMLAKMQKKTGQQIENQSQIAM